MRTLPGTFFLSRNGDQPAHDDLHQELERHEPEPYQSERNL
jgi:hypothetical protein